MIYTLRRSLQSSLLCLFVVFPLLVRGETADQWHTVGFKQANTMGGGEASIPQSGKFRVFVLMGQSNMAGAAKAAKLMAPYSQPHDRIRIWANGRWESFVPQKRFGPEVSLAHQLAEFWPADTIGIIKVASGGTGIRGFEKEWSFERANLTFDGKKGSLYQDLMRAVDAANSVSQLDFCGFVWNQGGADATKQVLADTYYDTFRQMVSDMRLDLCALNMPVFVLTYATDAQLAAIEHMAGGKRPYLKQVLMAHNRAGRDIPNTVTVHHGRLPVMDDGIHFNAEGMLILGKMTADAVEALYVK